jgi:hypothetical protein
MRHKVLFVVLLAAVYSKAKVTLVRSLKGTGGWSIAPIFPEWKRISCRKFYEIPDMRRFVGFIRKARITAATIGTTPLMPNNLG